MKLVTLCSGGLDSTTLVYYLARDHTQMLLFVHYGQKHVKEHFGAMKCADDLGVHLVNVAITGAAIFRSALISTNLEIPSGKYAPENLAATVVPNRNSVMANLAAALCVSLDYDGIALAVHAGDHAVYPDCSPEFIHALQSLLTIATGRPLRVEAPFLYNTKSQIVFQGAMLGVPFEKTWSCYKGGELHCGVCSTCIERKQAFVEAGVEDPTEYEEARHQGMQRVFKHMYGPKGT